jgi:hypothetical protein
VHIDHLIYKIAYSFLTIISETGRKKLEGQKDFIL